MTHQKGQDPDWMTVAVIMLLFTLIVVMSSCASAQPLTPTTTLGAKPQINFQPSKLQDTCKAPRPILRLPSSK